MSFRSSLPFLIAVFVVAVAGVALGMQFFSPDPGPQTELVTVVVYVTNTPDPNVTPNVIIVTPTSERTVVDVPEGLVPTGDAASAQGESAALQVTPGAQGDATSGEGSERVLPEGCLLHIVDSGDTIFGLAEEYAAEYGLDVNPFEVLQANGLSEDSAVNLQIGDELIIPLETCPLEQIVPLETDTPIPTLAPEVTAEVTEERTAEATDELSPTPEFTPTPSVSPTVTLAPTAENSQLEIVGVLDAGDVTAEGIRIRNPESNSTVTVTGWTLSDLDGNVYTFRNEQRIFSNSEVTIFTRSGQDTPIALFWGLEEAVWQPGDVVTLRDADGDVQAIYRIEEDGDLP